MVLKALTINSWLWLSKSMALLGKSLSVIRNQWFCWITAFAHMWFTNHCFILGKASNRFCTAEQQRQSASQTASQPWANQLFEGWKSSGTRSTPLKVMLYGCSNLGNLSGWTKLVLQLRPMHFLRARKCFETFREMCFGKFPLLWLLKALAGWRGSNRHDPIANKWFFEIWSCQFHLLCFSQLFENVWGLKNP